MASADPESTSAVHAQRVVRGFLGRLAGQQLGHVQRRGSFTIANTVWRLVRPHLLHYRFRSLSLPLRTLFPSTLRRFREALHAPFIHLFLVPTSSTPAGQLGVRKDLRSEDPRILLLQHLHL